MFYRVLPCPGRSNLLWPASESEFTLPSGGQSTTIAATVFGRRSQNRESFSPGINPRSHLGNISGNATSEVNMQRWL